MPIKKSLICLLLCFLCTAYTFCACLEDNRSLTEKLFLGDTATIFSCTVFSASQNGNGQTIAIAKIIEVYSGSVDTSIVTLNTGYTNSPDGSNLLLAGKTYLVFSRGTGIFFDCCNKCDTWSKQISEKPDSNAEVKTIKQFVKILRQKESGNFVLKNENDNPIAEGSYISGKAIGIWKHYYNNGKIKTFQNLEKDSIVQYTYYENKTIHKLEITGSVIQTKQEFSQSGTILHKEENTVKDGLVIKKYISDYFENGKPKQQSQFLNNRRYGVWKWYNADGSLNAEFDYKDGSGPQ